MPVVCMSTRKNVNELSQRKPSNCRLASYQFTTVRKHVIGVLDDTPRLILGGRIYYDLNGSLLIGGGHCN